LTGDQSLHSRGPGGGNWKEKFKNLSYRVVHEYKRKLRLIKLYNIWIRTKFFPAKARKPGVEIKTGQINKGEAADDVPSKTQQGTGA